MIKKNQESTKEYDKRKSHKSNKMHVICIPSNNVRHPVTKIFTTLHPATLHYSFRHFTSSHLNFTKLQGDSVARGPKLLSIKNYVIEIMTSKFIQYTHTGNDGKQDLLVIDAETDLLSHPSTLECVSPNSGILFPKCRR